jgi:hypothetical protein
MRIELEFTELATKEQVDEVFGSHRTSTGMVLVREFLHPETRVPMVAFLLGGEPGEPAMGFTAPFALANG